VFKQAAENLAKKALPKDQGNQINSPQESANTDKPATTETPETPKSDM
jgi:hypothetical protein